MKKLEKLEKLEDPASKRLTFWDELRKIGRESSLRYSH